jgi:hypothetical protein
MCQQMSAMKEGNSWTGAAAELEGDMAVSRPSPWTCLSQLLSNRLKKTQLLFMNLRVISRASRGMVAEKRLQHESWLGKAERYHTSPFHQSINQSDEDALTLSPKLAPTHPTNTETHTTTHTKDRERCQNFQKISNKSHTNKKRDIESKITKGQASSNLTLYTPNNNKPKSNAR